jgi:hypothetical protein
MAFTLDPITLDILDKYRVAPVGDKALKELVEVHTLHTSRYGKVGFRHWQPLYQITSSTRGFLISGYHNEWVDTGPIWRKLSAPTNDRLVAIVDLTQDMGWFAVDPRRPTEIQFPSKKPQKIDLPAGMLKELTAKPAIYLEVKGKKLFLEYPLNVGMFKTGKQGQVLADLVMGLMLKHANFFAIGHATPTSDLTRNGPAKPASKPAAKPAPKTPPKS